MSHPAQTLRPVLVSAVVGLLAATALLTTAGAHAATSYSTSSYAGRLLTLVNDARAQLGLRQLVLAPGTTTVAWDWTRHLADGRVLCHNQQLGRQLSTHGSSRWRVYGENVGVGSVSDPDGLFAAYMRSPEHRANILNSDYRYVGVAVVFTGSRSWNTFDFVDVYGLQPMHHAGRRHVQRSAQTSSATPKAATRPVDLTSSALLRATPARATTPRATPTRVVRVHVKALHHAAAAQPLVHHRFVGIAAGPLPAGATHLPTNGYRSPEDRTQPWLLALAVLTLTFAARRWMLAAVRRNA